MEIDYNRLAKNDEGYINEIKKALEVQCNFKAGKLIGRVLHTLRGSLTYSESADLIQLLPDSIKIIYVSDWRLKANKVEINCLDSFVEFVMHNDKAHVEQVISGESMALNAIITTIKMLDRHIHFLSHDFLKYPIKNEIEEAMYKAA
ncbi:DUF2267 domain-containing protein [Fulvivirga sp. 29W222]|uniref:DUF2267 domain-containing protein n=1 Tax=Fulvivirga marina TaxID=2494733 RepID=A0A937FZ87_9BACT|nr:DUF2267 domain-containing protein [Fulvivirga marina]MBL6445616.1 DUF2267 domain-containing protein [Fulvivirga marina]